MMYSELQTKEVVSVGTGERFGYIKDLEIDIKKGQITQLIIWKRSWFQKYDEVLIAWTDIVQLGEDVILVK
ncbi:sporulation protein, YlmC/YmxH family [Pelagirhabdus alkalitolerans]|uniref:Sporulation protein, YlmC/YmxH family n=1 Tax=Pelagirhabdus alkalitolerans TaxID=1612202 RepID=A0A1G6H1A2_9BACI|nr:YlmC/YmxH family sporulation protein [Pelagirhabdus alkalitolerans]SDB87695.1 sporulation protein, YlmC/YmxH family [Pelagirhabdus alkalitolerans]